MGYGLAKINQSLIDNGDVANKGTAFATHEYNYILNANSAPTISATQASPASGFWKVDNSSR